MFSPPKERDKRKPQAWVTVWLEDYKGDVTHVRLPTNLESVLSQAQNAMDNNKKGQLKLFEVGGEEIEDGDQLKKGNEYIVTSKESPPSTTSQTEIRPIRSPKEEKVVSPLYDSKKQKNSSFLSPTNKGIKENQIQSIKAIVAQDMLDDEEETTDDQTPDQSGEKTNFSHADFNKQLAFNNKNEEFREEKQNIESLQDIETKDDVSSPLSSKEITDLEDSYPQNNRIYEHTWENQYKQLEEDKQDENSNTNKHLETHISTISTSSSAKQLEQSNYTETFKTGTSTIRSKHMDVHSKHELPFWEQVKKLGPMLFQVLRNIPEAEINDSVLLDLVREFNYRENSVKANWHQSVIQEMRDQFICPNVEDSRILFKNDIHKKLNSTLFSFERNGLLKDMCPNCIISGPVESGKTSVMFSLIQLLSEKLDRSGKWSEVFIFPVNWKKMLFTDSLDGFYLKFTQHVITSICNQRDSLRSFAELLKKFFSKLLRQKWLPNIGSKKFEALFETAAHAIRNIGRRIISLWNKNSLYEFLSITISLPNFLSEAFGFERVLLVYDNIDKTHIKMSPANLSKRSTIPLCHFIKTALQHSYAIISGEPNETENILKYSKDSPLNIRDRFTSIHTVGMISQDSIDSLLPNQLVVENIVEEDGIVEQHFIKTSELKGCPGYLAQFHQAYKEHISSPFFERDQNIDSQEPMIIRARNLKFDPEEMGEYAEFLERNIGRIGVKASILGRE